MALYYAQQYATTKLSVGGGINNSQTTGIVVQSTTGIDTTKPGILCINWSDPLNTSLYEYVSYTSIDGSNELQGVTRGVEGSTGRAHDNNVDVAWVLTESHINKLNDMFTTSGEGYTQIATPSNPSSGFNKLYFKNDDKLYSLSSAGTETDLASATQLNDTNGNEAIKTVATTSAVNELTVTNAATGGSPEISATGNDTNIHIAIKGKGNGLVKVSVLTQNNTTNAYKNNSVILTGWGFINANGATNPYISETVTFGITFSETPIVLCSGGPRTSAGGADLSGAWTEYFVCTPSNIGTTSFSANVFRTPGTTNLSNYDYVYTWIAIGAFN